MLSDHKLQPLGHIERRLRWVSPRLAPFFSAMETPPVKSRRKRARMLVVAAMFAGMALLGPRMLTEAEVKTRRSPPLPRTSPPVTTVALPKSRFANPAAVTSSVAVALFLGPPTTIATPSCGGRPEGNVDSRMLDWGPRHVHSVSRVA